jgi:predicted small secreted protein
MKSRILLVVVAAMMVAACNAFDDSNTPYEGFGPDIIPPIMGAGPFEGSYRGEMTLTENNCQDLIDAVDSTSEISFTVLQSSNLVSVGFDDETEASGSLDSDNKTAIVKHDASDTKIFHLQFSETGVNGECEYIEGAPIGDQLGEPCAVYSIDMSRQ